MQQHHNKTSYHSYVTNSFLSIASMRIFYRSSPGQPGLIGIIGILKILSGYAWYQENKNLFDTLQLVAQNKKLLKINTTLVRVIAIKAFIKKNVAGLNAGLASLKMVATSNIQKVSRVIGLGKALKYLDIDFKYYAKLNRKIACPASILDLCIIKHPSQLLRKEIGIIRSYCTDERCLHWPLASLYHQIKKDGAAFFCISTFYKYAKLLKLGRIKIASRRKNHFTGLRATRPLEILHADATLFRMKDNAKAYIYLVQDNFSRAILSFRTALECKAKYAFENIKYVHEHFVAPSGIEHCSLVTDDGSENHGEAASFVSGSISPEIAHLIDLTQ